MDIESPQAPAEEPIIREALWNRALVWSTFVLLAWVAFELTTRPEVAAIIACSKFGLADFQTAIWLRRRDPNAGRAEACSWICMAHGALKIAFASLGILVAILETLNGLGINRPPGAGLETILRMVGAGLAVQLLLTVGGCLVARRQKVLIWVGPALNRARKQNSWPPQFDDGPAEKLWIRFHLFITISSIAMIGFSVPLFVFLPLVNRLFLPWFVGALALAAAMGGGFFASISYGTKFFDGAFAAKSSDCWGGPDGLIPSRDSSA
jgi:hypothetical protein